MTFERLDVWDDFFVRQSANLGTVTSARKQAGFECSLRNNG